MLLITAGNPRVHYTPFLITIVRSYNAAIFVFLVDIFKARAIIASRSRAVKKPYGASLSNMQILIDNKIANSSSSAFRFVN